MVMVTLTFTDKFIRVDLKRRDKWRPTNLGTKVTMKGGVLGRVLQRVYKDFVIFGAHGVTFKDTDHFKRG